MTEDSPERNTLLGMLNALTGMIVGLYRLAPGAVVVAVLFGIAAIYALSRSLRAFEVVAVLVALLVAVVVLVNRRSFGEAALALVAGLFPTLTVSWTIPKLVAYSVSWILLGGISVLFGSTLLAANVESIYRDAVGALLEMENPDRFDELQAIGKMVDIPALGPRKRAEAIRIFAVKHLPVDQMPRALIDTGKLTAILQLDHLLVSSLVADTYRMEGVGQTPDLVDQLLVAIRQSCELPATFVVAFNQSKRAGLADGMPVTTYLAAVCFGLKSGVPPEDMYGFIGLDDSG